MDQEREDYVDKDAPDPLKRVTGSPWLFFAGCLVVSIALTGACSFSTIRGSVADKAFIWCLMLAGPITALNYNVGTDLAFFSLLVSPAIFAYPSRPRIWTAMVTLFALALWLFVGF